MSSRLESGRHPVQKTDFRPGSTVVQHRVLVLKLFGPGPGGSGGPREVPQGQPWVFLGPPGPSRTPRKKTKIDYDS